MHHYCVTVPTIAIDELTKRFGQVEAVDGLSFTATPGRVTAFLGPNGSGKTTTLRMLVGLAQPTSGTALIDGIPYPQLARPFHTVGVLLDGGFHPGRKSRDHLRILAKAVGVDNARIDAVLEFSGLTYAAKRRVGSFSTGMKQRLGLAAAMLTDPPVLILDEPLNGLDPEGIQWLRGLLRRFADEGRTVLLSSHVLAETEQIADDVVIISGGQLKAAAPIRELEQRLTPAVRVRTPQPAEAKVVLAEASLDVNEATVAVGSPRPVDAGTSDKTTNEFLVDATSEQVGELLGRAGILLHELVPQKQRLEELYFQMVGTPPPPQPGGPPPSATGVASGEAGAPDLASPSATSVQTTAMEGER